MGIETMEENRKRARRMFEKYERVKDKESDAT